jgi:hypothetical protein
MTIQQRAEEEYPTVLNKIAASLTEEMFNLVKLKRNCYIKGAEEWYNKGKDEAEGGIYSMRIELLKQRDQLKELLQEREKEIDQLRELLKFTIQPKQP